MEFGTFIKEAKEYYERLDSLSDPRTKDWLLVSSLANPLLASLIYLLVVNVGPRFMEKRQPFQIKSLMVIYNFGATALNLYCFTKILKCSWKAGYNYVCQKVVISKEPEHLGIANAIWWHYISKYLEMLDTIFFILRKKDNQITYLHVYHHTSIVALWWIGIKWVPGGSSFVGAMINSCVHVVMYSYYGLSVFPSLRGYLWWKRYLTQFQLVQFLCLFLQAVLALREDCGFPRWMAYALITYMMSMILLFGNFYLKTYLKTRLKLSNGENGKVQNGKVQNGKLLKGD
ncbi:elongation of very long chain fatty acids protein 4-like [Xenia sp. Carnegie-2017]|uniref:elongation of very long chain fatty acids protein 4-like n=1 Tax=Xenia sp. Carnegie-2017 TaxID=2897299 RepID=UPI001F03B4D4|nr:elongation of very long chain fatty acids protein 4-like [Xenia sp. Carnegie-2017]XP_046860863.1 elongation of very long chain fatty acids protein 4-like [Xenia sp. Carnegie-2017]